MAITFQDHPASASQTEFAFNFPYLEDEHVTVFVDGVQKTLTTDFTIQTSPTKKVILNTPATGGEIVRVRRISAPAVDLVDFVNGSVLTESELDRAYLHNRYLAEESSEQNDVSMRLTAGAVGWDGLTKRILNIVDPVNEQDVATKNYVDGVVGDVALGEVPDDSITYAKIQDAVSNNVLLGNDNGAGEEIQELNATEVKAMLNIEDGTVTEINSGTGLTGGPINTSGTLSLAPIANLKALGNVSGGSAAPVAIEIKDEDTMTSDSDTALATQQSIKAYVDTQGVSKFTYGWTQLASSGADGTNFTVTHNLGTSDVSVQIYVNSTNTDTNAQSISGPESSANTTSTPVTNWSTGAAVTGFPDSNSLTIQLATNGYQDMNSSGGFSLTSFNNQYIKVVVIG
jgi:hypothetical protein